MFEVTINIPALDKLADAINNLAGTQRTAGGYAPATTPIPQAAPTPAPIPQAAPTPAPVQPPVAPPPVQTPITPPPVPVPPAAAPVAPPATYTLEQLSLAASPLMDAGKMNELMGLLAQFGVQSLQQLKPEQYGAVATALRALGAQI